MDTINFGMIFKCLPLVFKNTLRNRRRSILTILGITCSICLLGVLTAVYRMFFFDVGVDPAEARRLVIRHKVSLVTPLPSSYRQKIELLPGIEAIMHRAWFGGYYKDPNDPKYNFARFAVEAENVFQIQREWITPLDQQEAFKRELTGCIAEKKLVDKLGWRLGERITLVGDIWPVTLELKLVGIFENPDFEGLFFHYKYLRESLPAGSPLRDMAQLYVALAKSAEDIPKLTQQINAMFENSPAQTRAESEAEFRRSLLGFLGNVKMFLIAICGAITFTILLVSGNTISMSVRERIREIGIMKTLGFTPRSILGILLGESAMISLIGGILGLIIAAGLCLMIRNSSIPIPGKVNLLITPLLAAFNLLIAVMVGVVSALWPASGASRTSIIESLRHSG